MEQEDRTAGAMWAALLSPAVAVVPPLVAGLGGSAGWLAPLVALPFLLLLMRGWSGMAQRRRLPAGLTIIYIMWALLLGAARLRSSVCRLRFTAQREMSSWVFLLAAVVWTVWSVWDEESVFLRGAAVIGRVLTVVLAGVLGLTLFQVRAEELFPVWTGDVWPVLKAAGSVLGVLCYGAYGVLLRGRPLKRPVGRTVGGCGLLSLLLVSVLGGLGAELSGQLEDPFLALSRRVGVTGAFQRIESLISALWLLSDLVLLGVLLWACRRLLAPQKGHWVVMGAMAGMLLLLGTVFRSTVQAQWFERVVMPLGNLILGGAVPCVLTYAGKGKGISCGEKA